MSIRKNGHCSCDVAFSISSCTSDYNNRKRKQPFASAEPFTQRLNSVRSDWNHIKNPLKAPALKTHHRKLSRMKTLVETHRTATQMYPNRKMYI